MKELIDIVNGELFLGAPGNVTGRCNTMNSWRLVELRLPAGKRSRYLVGEVGGQARVCPDVVKLDIERLQAVTAAGRVYSLLEPGNDFDADFVLAYWMRLQQIRYSRDLTRAVLRLKSRHGQASDAEAGRARRESRRRPVQARLL